MEFKKLINTRKAKGLTQQEMAFKVAMEQTTYSRKERGLSPINDLEWVRFAKALNVTVDDIKELHQNFHYDGSNNLYVNLPREIYDILIKYNHKLEEENNLLRRTISE